jgi:hypothetical protein
MRKLFVLCLAAVFVFPAFAQEPIPPEDWSEAGCVEWDGGCVSGYGIHYHMRMSVLGIAASYYTTYCEGTPGGGEEWMYYERCMWARDYINSPGQKHLKVAYLADVDKTIDWARFDSDHASAYAEAVIVTTFSDAVNIIAACQWGEPETAP